MPDEISGLSAKVPGRSNEIIGIIPKRSPRVVEILKFCPQSVIDHKNAQIGANMTIPCSIHIIKESQIANYGVMETFWSSKACTDTG